MSARSTRRRGNKFQPNADELKVIELIVAGVPVTKAFTDCNVTYAEGSRASRYRNTKRRAGKIVFNVLAICHSRLSPNTRTHTPTEKIIREREKKQEDRRKRKWHQVAQKGEKLVELKRQANDAEIASRRAKIVSQERDAECKRAVLRQV